MIEVNGLTKKYGNHYAIKDLSFSIEKGKVYGFLGPNGAGKSTTMNIITGYLAATSGSVTVDGHDILKESEAAKKCIGYLPELPPLYPDMTVLEYLKFVAELKKVPKKERMKRIEEIMDKTMILDMKDRMIKNLSKGYKQRVGLAQAIMGYPDVIILDEPTVGLDPKQIIEIRELIVKLKENHTIILSSHILSEVSAVCDHIMIISHGKLVASDSVENLNMMMNGEMNIELLLKCDKEAATRVLDSISNISSYSLSDVNEAGEIEASITSSMEIDIRDVLSLELAKAGIPIYKLLVSSKSLEDIFLELTDSETIDETIDETGDDIVNNENACEEANDNCKKEVEENDSDL